MENSVKCACGIFRQGAWLFRPEYRRKRVFISLLNPTSTPIYQIIDQLLVEGEAITPLQFHNHTVIAGFKWHDFCNRFYCWDCQVLFTFTQSISASFDLIGF